MREDHRRLAVRTEGMLASRLFMKKRVNGTIEHNTLPLAGRERDALSHRWVPLRDGDGIVVRFSILKSDQYRSHSQSF
jgi:hypothetical protein